MESDTISLLTSMVNYLPRLLLAVVVLVLTYWLSKYVAQWVRAVLKRSSVSAIHKPFLETLTKTLIFFAGVIVALHIVGLEGLAFSLLAGGGVTAVIFGFCVSGNR